MIAIYIRKIYNMGKVIDVENHYPGNFGAPGVPREPKKQRTPEEIARQNHSNRVKKVQRLILMNFKEGDLYITLSYKKDARPETLQQARDNLQKFLARMRKEYKKAGYTFKYIGVTEIGKRGQALHHHFVIENQEDIKVTKLLRKNWTFGGVFWRDLYEEGEYKELAEYIVKKETKVDSWNTYTRSRGNLIEPKPERKIMKRRAWPKEPKPKKGYEVIKDSVLNGLNPVTGYPYQHYSMRKIEGRRRNACNNLHRDRHERSG